MKIQKPKNPFVFLVQMGLTAFFVMAALMQFNDEDGFLWVCLYVLAAGAMCAHHVVRLPRLVYAAFSISTLIWAGWTAWNSMDSIGITQIEERREVGGLLLCTLALGWMYVLRRSPTDSDS